jgi:DnaJ-class molecular chaperone
MDKDEVKKILGSEESFYDILGVDKSADEETIRSAYKRKARIYHPDRFHTASDEEKKMASDVMSRLNLIVETLTNPVTRDFYNLHKKGADEYGLHTRAISLDDLPEDSDVFDVIFGDQVQAKTGEHAAATAKITLRNAYEGGITEVEVGDSKISVPIPKGVKNQTLCTLFSKGKSGVRGGKNGHLIVLFTMKDKLNTAKEVLAERKDNDIYLKAPKQALTLDSKGVPTAVYLFRKNVTLRNPEKLEDNIYRYKGLGFENVIEGKTGDMLIEIVERAQVE